MNRIILAYSNANADLAQHIDNQLSRIGIPFEHMAPAQGPLGPGVFAAGEPVLLLVTDNFLKDQGCMEGLTEGLQRLPADVTLLPVLADGKDEDGKPVVTQIDRMVNMLHYMNHWQSEWLKLSAIYQNSEPAGKLALEPKLDIIRTIANQTSDLITALREKGAVTLQQLEANDFALFFQHFGLSDWHGQYRRLVAQGTAAEQPVEPALLPETPLHSGLLAPEPVIEPIPAPEPVITAPEIPTAEPEHIIPPITVPEATAQEDMQEKVYPSDLQIEQTIRDAQFWIDRGHAERGVELLKIAAEEYPDNASVAAAYQRAAAQLTPAPEVSTPAPPAAPEPVAVVENDVQSYEMMGDMAFDKGDYLFAKYCWDRVAEVHPEHTGIYRKLGLMTAEHLHDYRETAIHYLQKALQYHPDDQESGRALQSLQQEAMVVVPPPAPVPEPEVVAVEPVVETAPMEHIPAPAKGIVLITGATSGIGRATAEIFAKNGYRLILTGRRVERLVEVKNHLEAACQTEALLLPFDVRDPGAVQAALANLPESFQEIDILINNAGLAKGLSPIYEGSLEHWETMIDTNVKGLLYVTRVVSPGMVARKRGHIINVCSSAGKEVYPNGNVYCATKFAVDALTRSMRLDLHAHNIRVSQVSPGHVEETEFAITRFDGDAERAKIYNDFQPLKSSDVAEVIYFMVTRPPHVNVQDVQMFATQQASSTVINRSGRD